MSALLEEDVLIPEALPVELASLIDEEKFPGLPLLLGHVLQASRTIADHLRDGAYTSRQAGTVNDFGDNQLEVDMKTDALLFAHLKASKVVAFAASEETSHGVECEGEGFSCAFDPLDGSSIVDANFAVGTIMGIWPGKGFLHRTGREQVAALIVVYGPRVTMGLALNNTATTTGEAISMELTRTDKDWRVTVPRFSIAPTSKYFAPGNLRATHDNDRYRELINHMIDNKYTLRYSGGLVPDVYHILIKGGGLLTNASSERARAKLRLLFECAPIALIVEAAGGLSCACPSELDNDNFTPCSILDLTVDDHDGRIGVAYGSSDEVKRLKITLFDHYH